MANIFMDLTNIEGNALNASQCLIKSHLSCLAIYITRYFALNFAKVRKIWKCDSEELFQ